MRRPMQPQSLVSILLVADEFRLAAVEIDILKVQPKMLDNVIGVQLMEFPCVAAMSRWTCML